MSQTEIKQRKKGKAESVDMTSGPLLGKILAFSLPLMATGVLQLLFNVSDTIVAGRLAGETALAAVGGCGALINLLVNLFMGLSVGAGVAVANDLGAKNHKSVEEVLHTSVLTSLITGVAVGVAGFFLAEPLLVLMDTPTDDGVLREAVQYMQAYFIGMPACMFYNYAASILRSAGDTKHPLLFLVISGSVNVVLNIVLVCSLGEGNGALSVGIATAASQYVAAIAVAIHMCRLTGCLRLTFARMRIVWSQLARIMRIGLPAGLQGCLFSLSNVLIQSTVNGYGTVVIGGNTAASSVEGFVYISMNALYQAAVTFVGQNMGARKYERIGRIALCCVLTVTVVGLTLGWLAVLFGEPLVSLFSKDKTEAVVEAGMRRMWIICTTYFLCGLMDVGCGLMRGIGKSVTPMIVSLLGSCVFRIVWIYTVCPSFPDDIRVLYLSYPISWFLTAAVHFAMFFFCKRKIMRTATTEQPVLQD